MKSVAQELLSLVVMCFGMVINHQARADWYVSNLPFTWPGGGIGDIHNLLPAPNPWGTYTARFTTGAGEFDLNFITLELYTRFYAPQWVDLQLFRDSGGSEVFLGSLGNPVVDPTPTPYPQSLYPYDYTVFVDFSPSTDISLDSFSQYSLIVSMASNSPASTAVLFTPYSDSIAPTDWSFGVTSSEDPYLFGRRLIMGVDATLIPEPNGIALMCIGVVLIAVFHHYRKDAQPALGCTQGPVTACCLSWLLGPACLTRSVRT